MSPQSVVDLGESGTPLDFVRVSSASVLYTPGAQFVVADGASAPYPTVAVADPTTQFIAVGQGVNEVFVSVDSWGGGVFGAVKGSAVPGINFAALPYTQATAAFGPWQENGTRVYVSSASGSDAIVYWQDAHAGVVLSKTLPKPVSPGAWFNALAHLATPPGSFPAKIQVVWNESFGGNPAGAVYYNELSCE